MGSVRVRVMSCKDTIRLICEYLEGKLAPPVAREVLNHIDRCKNCGVVLEAAQRILEAYFDREAEPPRPSQQVA
ncbi:MAG: zf-HC2 domain-containing protein [Candidatus Acidiferrales bacterium]